MAAKERRALPIRLLAASRALRPGEVNVLGWLRRLSELRRRTRRDPAEAAAHELQEAYALRDLERMKDQVLEAEQHNVARGGGGGVLPPR